MRAVNTLSYAVSEESVSEVLTELYTLRDFLRWGFTQFQRATLFYGHGTDNAWDEILYLVLGTLTLGPVLNPKWLDARLTHGERLKVLQNIQRRIHERLPVAYLVKQAWFSGLSFYVDSRVLIPRSPLAELIERQFRPWIHPDKVGAVLDLGTGSGCIAIACADALPEATVDAVDCSAEALAVASINVAQHQLSARIALIQSTCFENLRGRYYDIIISNPPYVDAKDVAALPAEYRHEPMVALAAGTDGLEVVSQILQRAKDHLKKGGVLIVEVGNSQSALLQRFPEVPFTWLAFERGESEVFLLTREQLIQDV